MAYQQELIEAACYHVDEQTIHIQAFKLLQEASHLPSRLLELHQLVAQHSQSLGKLLRHIYPDHRVHVDVKEVRIATTPGFYAIILLNVINSDLSLSRLKCILPSDKNDNQNEVQYFDNSAAMVEWLKTYVL